MKAETKKLIVTAINIVIFIGNAILSALTNNEVGAQIATIITGVNLSIVSLV